MSFGLATQLGFMTAGKNARKPSKEFPAPSTNLLKPSLKLKLPSKKNMSITKEKTQRKRRSLLRKNYNELANPICIPLP